MKDSESVHIGTPFQFGLLYSAQRPQGTWASRGDPVHQSGFNLRVLEGLVTVRAVEHPRCHDASVATEFWSSTYALHWKIDVPETLELPECVSRSLLDPWILGIGRMHVQRTLRHARLRISVSFLPSDSPTSAPEGLNTHVHSANARSLTQTNLRCFAALDARMLKCAVLNFASYTGCAMLASCILCFRWKKIGKSETWFDPRPEVRTCASPGLKPI